MRMTISLGIVAASLLVAGAAVAFPFEFSWHMPADGQRAGAGGIYGTGGQLDYQLKCSHCHVGAPGKIGTTVTPTPAWGQKAGAPAYQPGTTYTINVALTGEVNKGFNGDPNNNLNGFALSPEDQLGKLAGVLISDTTPAVRSDQCPSSFPATRPGTGTTYVYGDCHAVFSLNRPKSTSWTFKWIAPAAGTGPVTLFYGVVDGDSDGESSKNDDVKNGSVKLAEM